MAEVTIIVTTIRRPWLSECLASVPQGVNLTVVDDGELRLGYARARLHGLVGVTTPYVAFLDDDDVLLPNWLPLHLAAIQNADVVAGSYIETAADLRPLRTHILQTPTLADFRNRHCPVNDGALIRRSVLENVTWHPERDTVMMFSLWLELAVRGARFRVVNEPTWLHRLHGANMSAKIGRRDAKWRREAIAEWA